jgi:hypothetical protein
MRDILSIQNHMSFHATIQSALAAGGVVITSAATIAVSQNIGVFTAFVAMGAAAGVFYSFLAKGGGLLVENRRTVKARVIVGMIGGIGLPRLGELFLPWFRQITVDPILLIMAGFACAWLSYSIGHAVFQKLDKRENAIAATLARAAEKSARIQDDASTERPNPDN